MAREPRLQPSASSPRGASQSTERERGRRGEGEGETAEQWRLNPACWTSSTQGEDTAVMLHGEIGDWQGHQHPTMALDPFLGSSLGPGKRIPRLREYLHARSRQGRRACRCAHPFLSTPSAWVTGEWTASRLAASSSPTWPLRRVPTCVPCWREIVTHVPPTTDGRGRRPDGSSSACMPAVAGRAYLAH